MATTIDYPEARLSLPIIPGYGIEPQDGVARTDMDAGPARQRRRWTATPTVFPVTFLFTRYELAIFEGWHAHDLDDGAAWFNIPLLGGVGLVAHEARFKGTYKAQPRSAELWTVSATLEIRSRPILDAGATAILIEADIGEFIAAIDAATAAAGGLPPAPYYWQWN